MIFMKTTTLLGDDWIGYEKTIAKVQLENFGIIFLDEFEKPIDNEFDLEDLFKKYIKTNDALESRKFLSLKEIGCIEDYDDFCHYECNSTTYYDGARTLYDVGYAFMLEILEKSELEQIEEHIDFEGIGNDIYLDMSIEARFTKYGFIMSF